MGKIISTLILCWVGLVSANVAVTDIFGSNMVLQRDRAISVWGTAANGESVSVTLNGQTRTTTASNGQWRVELPSMPAGGPFTMTIQGNNVLTFTDVMVGEVWHCAGQSNMDTRMNYWEYPNLADSITAANYPLLRYKTMRQPRDPTTWQKVSPSTVGPMSATAYFMGRELLDNLNGVAVGMVITAVGGTTIDTWMDSGTKASIPALAQSEAASSMYSAWVEPVVGYGIRGTVWLQGENNTLTSNYGTYGEYLPKLITGWRQVWSFPEMPFLVAGLSNKGALQVNPGENSNVASIREFQRTVTDTMPFTWLSVLADLGEIDTWHYSQKPQAGVRLGRLARGAVYGHTGFVYEHPRPAIAFMRGNQIFIPFDTRGSNLQLNGGTAPTGFAVAGANNAWSWASSAELKGDTVILTASMAEATQIKYAWANTPIMNLTNSAGIPATPFHLQIVAEPIVIPPFTCDECESQLQSEEPVKLKSLIHHAPQLQSRRSNITWSHLTSSAQIQVFNLQGKLVFSQKTSANSGQISTNTWQRGLYVVHINSVGQKLSQVVKVH
ncbi:MAG: T9SS type A sorting domain-containing protein [Fibrobacter sp.]|nr:T9SS type A sorting domain-containing protein [Fibrobacter sp.]